MARQAKVIIHHGQAGLTVHVLRPVNATLPVSQLADHLSRCAEDWVKQHNSKLPEQP